MIRGPPRSTLDRSSAASDVYKRQYILKTAIYTGLASSTALKNTPDGAKYIDEAFTAFKKYKEMDASMALATDPIYQNGPVNLYSNLYSSGYDAYSKNNWQPAFEKLKSAVEMSDVLLGLKILTVPIDTNVLILAGITLSLIHI